MELIDLEKRRNQRKPGTSLLVMLELDHFKPIIDTTGHAAGDSVL